ncbi:MAG: alkaline phosphatase family protein [Gammaproteobacteria bacterium]|nr:alkaline phosphatase family protein [Gammaproteobacteria bacterium]
MILSRYLLLMLVAIATMLASSAGVFASTKTDVKLVLIIAVDQLRPDRITDRLPGGLGRLIREGRVYVDAGLDHAITNTCPGHATILTGLNPSATGIVGNDHFDREAWETVYCVADRRPDARVFGQEYGRSPRMMRATTLGDWLKDRDPNTRVVSLSLKDRSAITMGGEQADLVYWFDTDNGRLTTSRYYTDAKDTWPTWVEAFNGTAPLEDGYLSRLPDYWEHPAGSFRDDDFHAERDEFSRASPHPLGQGAVDDIPQQFYASPWADRAIGELAIKAMEAERLGRRGSTDLLAVGFSATDSIGHLYGPFSAEAADGLRVLDEVVDELLAAVDNQFDAGEVITVLTADHGVAKIPEWDGDPLTPTCPHEEGRVAITPLAVSMYARLYWEFSFPFASPFELVGVAGSQIYVNEQEAGELGVSADTVIAWIENDLESEPYIREVWRADELNGKETNVARLYRNSYFPERSGDLIIQNEPGCLISGPAGTTHGTPYDYDRRIPLVFRGRGFEPGAIAGEAHSIDIAPTLAPLLGITPPVGLHGRDLRNSRH